MIINTIGELDSAKLMLNEKLADLHEANKDLVVYSPSVAGQRAPRHLYIVKDLERARSIRETIQELKSIKDAITAFYGSSKRRNNLSIPVLRQEVAMVRIWVNDAVSSRSTSKDKILNRLERHLEISNRYDTIENRARSSQLEKEIQFFNGCDEQDFIIRSTVAQDVIMRLYYENNEEERMRLTAAGVFIMGHECHAPKVITPNINKKESTKHRPGVFDNLTPIPYSGAPNALLYKKSEADNEKARIGFQKDSIINQKKNEKRQPSTE